MTKFVRITQEFWVEVEPNELAVDAIDRANNMHANCDLCCDSQWTEVVNEFGEVLTDPDEKEED